MFETIISPSPDEILQIMADFAKDSRSQKIDLGVGVYKDETGRTPIMKAVRDAEARLMIKQETKVYVGMQGDVAFNAAMKAMVMGECVDLQRVAAVQTPGGSGALRMLSDYLNLASKGLTVHVPDPTWANHGPILEMAGLKHVAYPYFDPVGKGVRFDAMLERLRQLGPEDVVLFHGCCHNPTGADLTHDQWDRLALVAADRGFVPFVDLAYLGFGDGLEADAYGVRKLAASVGEMVIAVSCSKNFSIYRERTGVAMVLTSNQEGARSATATMSNLARVTYSMPPDHGAAVVREILDDDGLRAKWQDELDNTRQRIVWLREKLVAAFRQRTNSDRFDFIGQHKGMFSVLGLTPDQVDRLRNDYAVYMVGDSRINLAGLKESEIERFVEAVVVVAL